MPDNIIYKFIILILLVLVYSKVDKIEVLLSDEMFILILILSEVFLAVIILAMTDIGWKRFTLVQVLLLGVMFFYSYVVYKFSTIYSNDYVLLLAIVFVTLAISKFASIKNVKVTSYDTLVTILSLVTILALVVTSMGVLSQQANIIISLSGSLLFLLFSIVDFKNIENIKERRGKRKRDIIIFKDILSFYLNFITLLLFILYSMI